jgi:hypothetical protein
MEIIALLGFVLIWTSPYIGIGRLIYGWGPGEEKLGTAIYNGLVTFTGAYILGWVIVAVLVG